MKKVIYTIIITLTLLSNSVAVAGSSNPVPLSTGVETAESTETDLNEIVILCASDEEKKFEKEWGKYVAKNDLKGKDLQSTIDWVSNEADLHRHKVSHGDVKNDEAWKEERKKFMTEVARRALNPLF